MLIIFLNGTQSLLINDGLIFQNAVNIHFSGKSIQERGTLCQLKAFFNHRNVSTDVMNCFNDVENFIRLLTEAHIVYLAMYLLNMRDIDGNHHKPVEMCRKKQKFPAQIMREICRGVWCLPSVEDVNTILESETPGDKWCICHEGMISLVFL